MAEYIDREKTLSTLENTAKYYEMATADEWTKGIHYGLIHGVDNIVDNVPIADVIEREKINKAREEIQSELFIKAETRYMKGFNVAINICLRNLDKLIESESAE